MVLRYYILFDRINSWKMSFSFVFFNVNSFFIMENPSSKWIYEREPLEHQNPSYHKATDLVHCKPCQLGAVHPPINPENTTSVWQGLDQMAINMPSKPWLAAKSWIERVKLENHGFVVLVCESAERRLCGWNKRWLNNCIFRSNYFPQLLTWIWDMAATWSKRDWKSGRD